MIPSCDKLLGQICFLRPMQETDIPMWTKWFNDYDVLKYSVHRGSVTSEGDQRQYLIANNKHLRKLQFAICSLEGCPIGVISVIFNDIKFTEGNISIIIGEKEYWGQGIGGGAISLLVSHIHRVYGTLSFVAGCDIRNIGAQKSFFKNAFTQVNIISGAISYKDEDHKYDMIKLNLRLG
tara:strand:- start:286 stop:822 length:537 start_codon:yes stop_codon:yes gene_type:complete